jgi:hypothetical protein
MSSAPMFYYFLWAFSVIVQVSIACVMARRKLREEFPFFFYYSLFQALNNFGLLFVFHFSNKTFYFYSYWICAAVTVVLSFCVIREIFENAFRPFAALRDLASILFRWAAAVLLMVATVMSMTSPSSSGARITLGILTVERGVLLIQAGLLLFLLMYSSRLGMGWKHQGFGIALGFGFYAATHLILNSLRIQRGFQWHPTYNLLLSLCYNIAVFTWAVYIFSPEPARVTEAAQYAPKPILQRWNHVLSGEESEEMGGTFIPSMERIVDRVLASKK